MDEMESKKSRGTFYFLRFFFHESIAPCFDGASNDAGDAHARPTRSPCSRPSLRSSERRLIVDDRR